MAKNIFDKNIENIMQDMHELFKMDDFIELSINPLDNDGYDFFVEFLKEGYLPLSDVERQLNKNFLFKNLTRESFSSLIQVFATQTGGKIDGKDGSNYLYIFLPKLSVRIASIKNSFFNKNENFALSIRKINKNLISLEDYGLSLEQCDFLNGLIQNKSNFCIVGGTGAGKTTLINALLDKIDTNERVIVIQDIEEIKSPKKTVLNLQLDSFVESDTNQSEFNNMMNAVTRMNPDRFILSELSILNTKPTILAMNTGHKGSFFSMHANSASQAINKIAFNLSLGGMEFVSAKKLVESTLDVVVFLEREKDKFSMDWLNV